ncbi:MAG: zinc-ribbon domain-containing protein [Promethearchaeota archaeon]
MSNQQCPECGRQLKPNAKFCSYCGVSLATRKKAVENIQAQPASAAPVSGNQIPHELTEIPPTVESALIMRGKLERLRSQKAALDEEQETVNVKQLVGELSEKEAKTQSDKFQQRLDPITKEIEELESKAITPLEQLKQDKEVQEGRLQRLEELQKSGEVDTAIYQRLSSEYRGKLSEINQQLDNEVSQANRWLAQLEDRKQQLEFDKETLQIRARIDEVSKRDVNKQLKGIDDEVNKLTSIIGGLRSILGSAVAPPKAFIPKPAATPSQKPSGKAVTETCPYCQAKITPGSKWCYSCGRLLQG